MWGRGDKGEGGGRIVHELRREMIENARVVEL